MGGRNRGTYDTPFLKAREQLPHRFLEEKHCSWCGSHLYPGEMPSMPMFRVLQWERRVFKNRSIVLPTTLFCVLTVLCWHGVNRKTKRLANLMKKCFHRKRMFGEAEALQQKPFSVTDTWINLVSNSKYDEYGSRGKIGFRALEIFGLRLNWEVMEIFNWCQQQPSQVPTDIRRTNAVNEMGFSYRILRFITYTMAYRSAYQNMSILQTLLSRFCARKNTPFLE